MQYQLPIRTEDATYIFFSNDKPLKNVKKLNYYREGSSYGNFLAKDFRYSYDGINWEPPGWIQLTQLNITNLPFSPNLDFYIEVRYLKDGNGCNLSSFFLFFDLYERQEIPGNMEFQPVDSSEVAYLRYDFPYTIQDRVTHHGPFTDLEIKAEEDPSIYDLYSTREDGSFGSTFIFKGIKPGEGVTITEDSSYLEINVDASSLSEDISVNVIYENPEPVVATVGGIYSGETFFDGGKDFSETMEAIFYPTIYPTYHAPSSSFTSNSNPYYEINETISSITFNSNFNRGQILLNGQFQDYRSGISDVFNYSGTGLNNWNSNGANSHQETITNYLVMQGIQSWSNNVHYLEGPQPLDSKGNPYQSPLPAGNTSTDIINIEGVYPIYATINDINTLDKLPLYSMLHGNDISINLAPQPNNNPRQAFAIANEWLNNKPLQGVETWNAFREEWEYTGGSPAASLTRWDQSQITMTIQGLAVNYTKFEYNSDPRSTIPIRLKF